MEQAETSSWSRSSSPSRYSSDEESGKDYSNDHASPSLHNAGRKASFSSLRKGTPATMASRGSSKFSSPRSGMQWPDSEDEILRSIDFDVEYGQDHDERPRNSRATKRWVRALRVISRAKQGEKRRAEAKVAKVVGDIKRVSEQKGAVEMSGLRLVLLPVQVCHWRSIKKLWVHENRILRLPDELRKLGDLTMLRIYSNKLSRLPEALGCLPNLQVLWAFDNRIQTMPLSTSNLTALNHLSIQKNPILRLSVGLGNCKALQKLEFDTQTVGFPPADIVSQGMSMTIDYLRRAFDSIASKSLVLSGWSLRTLPHQLICSTDLTELQLYGNEISRLPVELGMCTNVQSLKLDEPILKFPPQEIVRQGLLKMFDFMRILYLAERGLHLHMPSWGLLNLPSECFVTWNLRTLNVEGNRLTAIPDMVSLLTRLELLNISKNSIQAFPDAVETLSTLITINATNTGLVDLPDDMFGRMTRLMNLTLSRNAIEELPSSLTSTISLQLLDVSKNQLLDLPKGMKNCTSLTKIDVSNNMVQKIRHEFGNCKKLVEFNILSNPNMNYPPPEARLGTVQHGDWGDPDSEYEDSEGEGEAADAVSALLSRVNAPEDPTEFGPSPLLRYLFAVWDSAPSKNLALNGIGLIHFPQKLLESEFLVDLDLSHNRLFQLPSNFTVLTNLVNLNLSNNMFFDLQNVLFGIVLLEVVNFSDNFLQALPKELGECVHLKQLYVDGNPLGLPSEEILRMGAASVVMYLKQVNIAVETFVLTLRGRGLEAFPEQLQTFDFVRSMDFSYNEVLRLPAAFGQMSCLINVDFSHNRLLSLPTDVSSMSKLETLKLDYNNIEALPSTFGLLNALKWFSCTENKLEGLPKQLGGLSNLLHFDVSRNVIQHLPDSLSSLTAMTRLNLAHNKLVTLPLSLSGLVSLESCSIVNNCLHVASVGFGPLPRLESLDWSDNPFFEPMIQIAFNLPFEQAKLMLRRLHAASNDGTKRLDWNNFGLFNFIDFDLCHRRYVEAGWHVRGLKTLNLQGNHILKLPDSISKLSALTVIDLQNNGTNWLPLTFSVLTSLHALRVPGCKIDVLPPGLGCSTKLQVLNCSGWHVRAPPYEVRSKHAQFSARYLRAVHHSISTRSLEWHALNLRNIESLPHAFKVVNLTPAHIKHLRLSKNSLYQIEGDILAMCKSLEVLDLKKNFLSDLPHQITTLNSLQLLDASHNALRTVPVGLGVLPSLESCFLAGNPEIVAPHEYLTQGSQSAIPAFLRRMHEAHFQGSLKLGNFLLPSFPECAVSYGGILWELDLQHNEIDFVPSGIGSLVNLTHFNVAYNHITHISNAIGMLTRLECLDISNNRLESIPVGIGSLEMLDKFDFNNNPLLSPSSEIMSNSVQGIVSYYKALVCARVNGELLLPERINTGTLPIDALQLGHLKTLSSNRNSIHTMHEESWRLSRLQNLTITRSKLVGSLPTSLGHFLSLVNLDLSFNKISSIPSTICWAANMKRLELRQNQLDTLPPSLHLCSKLEKIDVSQNPFKKAPARLGKCHFIQEFLIDPPPLPVVTPPHPIPGQGAVQIVRYLKGLFESWDSGVLNLEGFDLIDVPQDVMDFVNVAYSADVVTSAPKIPANYDMKEWNRLFDYWQGEKAKVELQSIGLSGNSISLLPKNFGDLRAIKGELNLSDNKLSALPSSIGNLKLVTILKFSGNQVASLPLSIKDMESLEILEFHDNGVEVLPIPIVTMKTLKELDFKNNLIGEIPYQIGQNCARFRRLEYEGNPLRYPHMAIADLNWRKLLSFCQMTCQCRDSGSLFDLSTFNVPTLELQLAPVSGQVTRIVLDTLPLANMHDEILQCNSVEFMSLQNCRLLKKLPLMMDNFPQLKFLYLDNCPLIVTLPNTLVECQGMLELKANHCSLEKIPDIFENMLKLQRLELSHNRLARLPPSASNLTSMTVLDLSHNQLEAVCKGVSMWSSLTDMKLHNNQLTRLPRGVGALSVYLNLKSLTLTSNPVEMPPKYIQNMGQTHVLQYLARLWRAQSSMGVDMISMGITDIRPEFLELKYLEQLYLGKNDIKEIPSDIKGLTNLRELNLADNKIEELPNELFALVNLNVLQLSNNRIKRLSARIAALVDLQWLSLENNPLQTLPLDISECKAIDLLQVSPFGLQTDIREVMKDGPQALFAYLANFKTYKRTKKADLSWKPNFLWSKLVVFPAQLFTTCTNLVDLNLNDNSLEILPNGISKLSSLTTISAARNKLRQVSFELLNLSKLKNLDLSENMPLKEPPASLVDTKSSLAHCLSFLSSLKASVNDGIFELDHLPMGHFEFSASVSAGLLALSLRNCEMTTFPSKIEQCQSLCFINLDENGIIEIPEEIGKLRRLRGLSVNNNVLDILPENFTNLNNLQLFSARHNRFISFPSQICSCTSLQELDLSNNFFEDEIAPSCFAPLSSLESISLSSCNLETFPATLAELSALQRIDVSSNSIFNLPTLKLPALTSLSIANNPLRILPDCSIYWAHTLEVLDISGTEILGLPLWLGDLRAIKCISIDSLPGLVFPPKDVQKCGNEEVIKYLQVYRETMANHQDQLGNEMEHIHDEQDVLNQDSLQSNQ